MKDKFLFDLWIVIFLCSTGQFRVHFLYFLRDFTCHEFSVIEEDKTPATLLFEPNNGCASDEDSADEDDGGMIDNLSRNQLNAPAQAILPGGRRIGIATFSQSDHEENMETNSTDTSYRTSEWSRDISLPVVNQIFPEADYFTYRDFSPVQLFELFYDEEAYNLILQ